MTTDRHRCSLGGPNQDFSSEFEKGGFCLNVRLDSGTVLLVVSGAVVGFKFRGISHLPPTAGDLNASWGQLTGL